MPLAVRTWGDPGGRPLVFWHPLGDVTSGAYATELVPALLARGLHVVAPDGPGFGESPALPPESYAVPRLAGLVWALVAQLGLGRPVLMGHSWGAVVMLAAAAERPRDASGLVLLDAGHLDYAAHASSHPEWSLETRAAAIAGGQPAYADRADLLRQLQDEVPRPLSDAWVAGLGPSLREQPDGRVEPVVTPLTRAAAQAGMLAERSLPRWATLAAAGLPVLLLLATEPEARHVDNEEGAQAVHAAYPGADVRLLAGLSHDLIADAGPEVAELVAAWVAGQPART